MAAVGVHCKFVKVHIFTCTMHNNVISVQRTVTSMCIVIQMSINILSSFIHFQPLEI